MTIIDPSDLQRRLDHIGSAIDRLTAAMERLAPEARQGADVHDPANGDAFIWQAKSNCFQKVERVSRIDITLLQGLDRQQQTLLDNTRRFAQGLPANNALLWGARGMGKSSLVKAAHASVNAELGDNTLVLIEIHREDLATLPALLEQVRQGNRRCLVFCDDLSFDESESSYKSLKAILEGGIEGRPTNAVFYATSNRRHLMPRSMIENEAATAINPGEAVEESVSLSDRFGLWIGFHSCDQSTYLEMINGYASHYGLEVAPEALRAQALEWSVTRGARSGRVAWQFIQDLAGQLGKTLD
ncbi:MAG: ATP-binding protein [Alphaproteobacteria bacterium]|nr:ATP-binding protein [Alphaproteobacteria bacterium SS10]